MLGFQIPDFSKKSGISLSIYDCYINQNYYFLHPRRQKLSPLSSPKQSPLLVRITTDLTVENCFRVDSRELLARASLPIPPEITVLQNFSRATLFDKLIVKSLP